MEEEAARPGKPGEGERRARLGVRGGVIIGEGRFRPCDALAQFHKTAFSGYTFQLPRQDHRAWPLPTAHKDRPMRRAFAFSLLCLAIAACAPGQRATKTHAPALTTGELPATKTTKEGRLLRLDYDGFTVWLDCKERAAVKFRYNAQRDTGSAPRAENFKLDPSVPEECQQTSTDAYGNGYDRGHQVPANHLDASPVAIKQSNYMTNILPQVAQMNRGAWLLTEEIIECYRDIDELLVLGGVVWGNNPADDFFVQSHGVRTPDAFWKVVLRGHGDAIAWVVPNTKDATKAKLDSYIVTVEQIEKLTGERLPVTGDARTTKPKGSWVVPVGCDRS